LGIQKITQIIGKNISQITFYLLKEAQAVVQKTARKNVTSTVLIFSSFLYFFMDVMGGKITVNLKELH